MDVEGWIMVKLQVAAALVLLTAAVPLAQFVKSAPAQDASATRVQVVFSGGHETDPRDKGRPVVLIAAALGVTPEVFREAFRRVQPAPAGTRPTREQERRNKAVLLAALSDYGVTNQRLDEVSDYYRYNRSRGELWPTVPATAYALLKDGKVTGFVVTDKGSGYSSSPNISVPGVGDNLAEAQLAFDTSFENNGSVASLSLRAVSDK